jgi:hypothetical protein
MKFIKIGWYGLAVLLLLQACTKEFEYNFPAPSLAFVNDVDRKGGVKGRPVRIGLDMKAGNELASLRVLQSIKGGGFTQVGNITEFSNNFRPAQYVYTYPVPETGIEIGDNIRLQFEMTDKAGNVSNVLTFNITVVGALFVLGTEGSAITLKPPTGAASTIINQDEFIFETGKKYIIEGFCQVEEGLTVIMQPGTEIYARTGIAGTATRFLIPAESKIQAKGTATQPIVMTSDKALNGGTPAPGDWQGIEVIGKGGTDNSGEISYLRVEFGGRDGIDLSTTGAVRITQVGSATILNYIQAFRSFGQGIRFNGGQARAKYLVSTESTDFAYRLDNDEVTGSLVPYDGLGQFWYAESSTSRNNHDFDIRDGSKVVLSNMTLLGPGTAFPTTNTTSATRLRTSTPNQNGYRIFNSLIAEYPNDGLRDDIVPAPSVADGINSPRVVAFSVVFKIGDAVLRGNGDSDVGARAFEASTLGNVFDKANTLVPGIAPGAYLPTAARESTFNPRSLTTVGAWFTNVAYVGAFREVSDNWLTGWAKAPDGRLR